MSDLSIGIVAEGITDFVVLEAALKAILGPVTFVAQLLQPEETQPRLGTGWGGIVRWGQQMRKLSAGCLDDCPTLSRLDLIIVHTSNWDTVKNRCTQAVFFDQNVRTSLAGRSRSAR